MGRFQRVAQIVAAVALVAVFVVLLQVRSQVDTATEGDVARAEQVSRENQQILDEVQRAVGQVDGGVEAIEGGYACLVALLRVQPEDRGRIDPQAFERVCGLSEAQVEYLLVALDAS